MKNDILKEASAKGRNGDEYYMEFLGEVFATLVRALSTDLSASASDFSDPALNRKDRNSNGKIEFDEFMKPDNAVKDFVATVSQNLARNPSRSHLIKAGNLAASAPAPAGAPQPPQPSRSASTVNTVPPPLSSVPAAKPKAPEATVPPPPPVVAATATPKAPETPQPAPSAKAAVVSLAAAEPASKPPASAQALCKGTPFRDRFLPHSLFFFVSFSSENLRGATRSDIFLPRCRRLRFLWEPQLRGLLLEVLQGEGHQEGRKEVREERREEGR